MILVSALKISFRDLAPASLRSTLPLHCIEKGLGDEVETGSTIFIYRDASGCIGTRRFQIFWMTLILLLGFAVLMNGLLDESLWADEGWTIAATEESSPVKIITDWVAVDVHPPLFFLGLNIWRRFTGDTIFEMRCYTVLLTMVGIAVIYRLGAALFEHRRHTVGAQRAVPLHDTSWHTAGLLAALFYALHDLVKVLTQEVRHYPQQMLLTTLVMWLYWRFWLRPTRGRGVAFALAGAALVYTHYWGGFVLMALALHAVMTRIFGKRRGDLPGRPYMHAVANDVGATHASPAQKRLQPFLLAFALIALLLLPWIPVLYNQITLERPGGLPHALDNDPYVYAVLTYQLIGVPELFWVALAFVGILGTFGNGKPGHHGGTTTYRPTASSGESAPSPLTGRDGKGLSRLLPSPAALMPLLIAVLTPALSILLNVFYPTLSFRSLAVIVPAVIVLAAHGLSRFRPREQTVLIVFILLYSLSTTSARPSVRPPWPQLVDDLVSRTTPPADVILLELDTDEHAVAYYLEETGAPVDFAYTESTREFHPDDYPVYLDDLLANHSGIWVAKLGWIGTEGEYDIRPDLTRRGYIETAPEQQYALHIDRPVLLWRLDRLPTTPPVTVFGDELSLARAEAAVQPGQVVVNLLWVPQTVPAHEYTISVILFGADRNVNQDSRPLDGASLTSTWEAGRMYFDSHQISTDGLPPGTYRVGVQVYYFTDASFTQTQNVPAANCTDDPDCRYVIIGEIVIE